MREINAVIVEDEENSRITLHNLITKYCEGVNIVGMAASIKEAVPMIQNEQPELVFLDIEMPQQNGFQLFEYFQKPNFETIFTTAYNQYAVKAFRFSAIDYLLKPIDLDDLREAITKVIEKRETSQSVERIDQLKENFNSELKRLVLPVQTGYIFIDLEDILYLEAQGNYTLFHMKDASQHMVSKTLKTYTDLLKDFKFFRLNRSAIVNLKYVVGYTRQKSPTVTLLNGANLSLSENRKKAFMNMFS